MNVRMIELLPVVAMGAALSIRFAPAASADPVIPQPGAASASDTISALQNSGFDVEINWVSGHPNVPLSECRVEAIHNPNGPVASLTTLSTVYVDVACPNAK